MLANFKKAQDKGLCTGILLTDLPKTFDCISHYLLIAKLKAYGFAKKSLNRYQRTKVDEAFSTWLEIAYGVP